jgi:iron complex outermembrane receptor protein
MQATLNLITRGHSWRLAGLTLATAGLPGLLFAQQTAATAANPPTPAEVVELNPFIVDASRETGYVASETLSGTRLKTEVRHIASPVTILTEEFLQDIGATSFADIVEFMPGTETYRFDDSDLRGEQAHNGRTFSARGFRADNQSRDFFNTGIPLDTYNTGSISLNRGPNSNLFGIGSAGGALTFGSRAARFDRATHDFELKFDSNGSQRTVYRRNQPVVLQKLALSFAALQEQRNGFRRPEGNDRTSVTLGAEWRPARHTTIGLNHERGELKSLRPYQFATYDWTTPWLAAGRQLTTPVPGSSADFPPPNSASVPRAIESLGNSSFIKILGTDYPIFEYNRSFGYGRRTYVNGVLERVSVADSRLLPLETYTGGFGQVNRTDFETTMVRVQQRLLPGLHAELAARREITDGRDHGMLGSNEQAVYIDPNPILANGQPNPFVGQPYIESSTNRVTLSDNEDEAWRFSVVYDRALPDYRIFGRKLGRVRLSAFYSEEESASFSRRLTQKVRSGGGNLRHRLYIGGQNGWYLPNGLNRDYTQARGGVGVPSVTTVWEEGTTAGDRDTRANRTNALSFVGHALLLDERLSLIAGYREDENTSETLDPGAESRKVAKHGAMTYGAVLHLNNWLSLFGNFGENFRPAGTGRIGIDAKHLPENLGTSRDFGLRFALFDRKIFGSFTYYDTKQLNQVRNSLGEIINDFDDVWDTIENAYATLSPATLAAARLPASPPARPTADATAIYSRNSAENNGNPGAIFADTLDSKSKGIELELTANPTPNWRLSWSVSQHLSTVSAARKTAVGYYSEHLPTWQRYVDPAGTIVAPLSTVYIQADMRGLRLADMLKAIANGFDETNAEVGGQRYGNREWSSNLVSRYTFREGWLKGWNAGGSVRWRDKALVGYAVVPATGFRNPSRPFFERDYWTMDAFVGHARKIFRNTVTWDSNLRVRDLNHTKVWTSVAAAVDSEGYTGNAHPTRRVLMAPISVELSSSFRW